MAAKKAGRSYAELIGEIVELALARYPNNGSVSRMRALLARLRPGAVRVGRGAA